MPPPACPSFPVEDIPAGDREGTCHHELPFDFILDRFDVDRCLRREAFSDDGGHGVGDRIDLLGYSSPYLDQGMGSRPPPGMPSRSRGSFVIDQMELYGRRAS